MAKKRKPTKKRKNTRKASASPQHTLPNGFWSQVGAVALVTIAILFVVSWFGAGGPVLDWANQAALNTIGYAEYIIPLLFVYLAVETFRADKNKLPFVVKFASVVWTIWFAGLFGLVSTGGATHGGFVGDTVNTMMLSLVNPGVASFIYVLLIAVTALFVLSVSPRTVFEGIGQLFKTGDKEEKQNVKVMRKAAQAEEASAKHMGGLKLNEGVPTLGKDEAKTKDKKSSHNSTLRGSVKQDKQAEEKSALVSVNDPNWQPPSLDLLEKNQSGADAGDYEQNAQTIHDTLAEFNINVEMEGVNIGPKSDTIYPETTERCEVNSYYGT